jgi:heterodisulfide reductase subunit A-like polyferredoxin/coenzyme F420-reducing hydrogenase delta subunit
VTPCASDGSKIGEFLSTGDFNRLIVAGPSPIPNEPLFQRHAEMAGLNRYLLEMVNLHNQCARVHSSNKTEATEKAKILMRMGVARARQLEPLEELQFIITQSCLVVGGTASGLACAAKLAEMGIHVHVVERAPSLESIPGNDHPLVKPLVTRLSTDDKVEVHALATVNDVKGCVGHFKVELVRQGKNMTVEVGAIVVATVTGIEESTDGKEFLALEKDEDGFYVSTQGILNLLDFTTEGVFNCGPARAALGTEDAVVDGDAAASRAGCVLASPMMVRPPAISSVVEENCDGCAYCVEPCPTRSITLLEFMQRGAIKKVVEVNEATCIGCGICMATCPKKGILVRHFKPECFSEMVNAALVRSDNLPVIVSFCCNRCAYPGADAAGSEGIQYPASVRIIRSVCSGMIHPNIIMDALTRGADGVLLCGCHPGNCRSREGIRKAQARAESIGLMLEDFGLEPERFRLELIAASEGPKFARVVEEMTEELSALGPNPYR